MKKRRLLRVLMLVCVLLCATALHAQEPYAVLNDDNTVLTFYYDTHKAERNGMSVGPFEYVDFPDNSPTTSWYSQCFTIKTVVFDASFADCTSLTSTAYWFYWCSNLTTITGIENLKTDNVTDMRFMFFFCSGLTSLDVSGFKTDNVTDMNNMFSYCLGLTSLDVSGFKTDNVTNMSRMFHGCWSLTSLDVSSFKTDNVTNMSRMFDGCRSLTSLDLSSFKTDNVTSIDRMFWDCHGLTTLDVSGFNTDNVTDMSGMFGSCWGLTTIYAGDGWSTEKVTYGSDMFGGCIKLVGGQGTIYDSNHTDYTYARIDGGTAAPGYFTDKTITGIPSVKAKADADAYAAAPVYNLSGQRMENPVRGLFIKNGKKVVVK